MTKSQLIQAALALSEEERAEVAHTLVQSLDAHTGPSAAEWESAWAREINARLTAMDAGQIAAVDADLVHAEARRRLLDSRG